MFNPLRNKRAHTAALLAATTLVLAPVLAGCADSQSADEPAARHTAANGDIYNDADVTFAQQMIPHHAQAIEMADMTRGRELNPEVAALADQIMAAQTLEIEAMTAWLTAWAEEVPETSRDHANAHGDGQMPDMSDEMPGMMSPEEIDVLESAPEGEFQAMWLEMMVEHHEGAIEMAQAEQRDGEFDEAVAMGEEIQTGQTVEVDHMKELLGS